MDSISWSEWSKNDNRFSGTSTGGVAPRTETQRVTKSGDTKMWHLTLDRIRWRKSNFSHLCLNLWTCCFRCCCFSDTVNGTHTKKKMHSLTRQTHIVALCFFVCDVIFSSFFLSHSLCFFYPLSIYLFALLLLLFPFFFFVLITSTHQSKPTRRKQSCQLHQDARLYYRNINYTRAFTLVQTSHALQWALRWHQAQNWTTWPVSMSACCFLLTTTHKLTHKLTTTSVNNCHQSPRV